VGGFIPLLSWESAMMRSWKLLVVAVLVLAGISPSLEPNGNGAQAQGDTAYTIKLKHRPDKGKSVSITSSEKTSKGFKVVDGDGKVLKEGKDDDTKDTVYTVKIVEGGEKKPKKFTETYEKASVTVKGKPVDEPYKGRTIVYELKGDKYDVTAEGQPAIDETVLTRLAKKANKSDEESDAFLPKKAVKVGESWMLDPKVLVKAFGDEDAFDVSKIKGEGKLLKVYDKGKRGIIEVSLKVPMKEPPGIKFDQSPIFEFTLTLDSAIDGSSTAGKMTGVGKLVAKGKVDKFDVEITAGVNTTQEQSAEK